LEEKLFGRPAAFLVRHHVHPNAVTITGTVATCGAALTLFPAGQLWPGALVVGLVATADALDGTMARITGTASDWGAFLDSTLDRICDAAIVTGLTLYFARCGYLFGLVAGIVAIAASGLVPYVRARAEALGYKASVGIAERSDRLVVTLVTAFATGLGAPLWVAAGGLALVAVGALVTVGQRAWAVYCQVRGAAQ
jgi:CDP-diacylglycerol--glycerol-3-phosphate 3-phosphatidyltransferase